MRVTKTKAAIGGLLTAGLGLLVASGGYDKRTERSANATLDVRPRSKRLTQKRAEALVKKLFPAVSKRNVTVFLEPFSATLDEMVRGEKQTLVGSHANCRKFVGKISYWQEGITEDLFMHEIGHLLDDYDAWLLTRDDLDEEMEQFTYNVVANGLEFNPLKRLLKGDVLMVEESAWGRVREHVQDPEMRKAALASYSESRKSDAAASGGALALFGAICAAGFAVGSSLVDNSDKKG